MINNQSIDLSAAIEKLRLFSTQPEEEKCKYLHEQSQPIYAVYDWVSELHRSEIIGDDYDKQTLINKFHLLVLHICQLQEIVFTIESSTIVVNRIEFVLEDMLEKTIAVLKELKKKQKPFSYMQRFDEVFGFNKSNTSGILNGIISKKKLIRQ